MADAPSILYRYITLNKNYYFRVKMHDFLMKEGLDQKNGSGIWKVKAAMRRWRFYCSINFQGESTKYWR